MRSWFRFENKAGTPTVVEIYIYDAIGKSYWDDNTVTAEAVVEQLQNLSPETTEIHVHVNSPGGDAFEAVVITNALRAQRDERHREVTVHVDGIAASAASLLLMAGSTVRIADNALVMVHNPWTVTVGNAGDIRATAAMLAQVRNTMIATYRWKSSLSNEALGALMDAETWMDADEAIANGFATEKVEGRRAAALFNPRAVAALRVPEKFQSRVAAMLAQARPALPTPVAAAAVDVVRICKDAGCMDLAESLLAAKATLEQVTAQVAAERVTRAGLAASSKEITGLCVMAGLPHLAAGYIAGRMPPAAVRAALVTITARADRVEVDGTLPLVDRQSAIVHSWKRAHASAHVNVQGR